MENHVNNWESEIILPGKENGVEYAYMERGSDEVVECSKEELLKFLKSDKKEISYITTPEHDSFIVPGSDFFSIVPILEKEKDELEDALKSDKTVFYLSLGLIVINFLEGRLMTSTISVLMLVLVVLPYLNKLYDLKKSKVITKDNFSFESQDILFSHWLDLRKFKSIYVFTALLIIIYILQFIIGTFESAELAGLDKIKTIGGDYCRIVTAIMMHGNILHLLINAMVLFFLGKIMIRITDIYVFSLVSLFSAILGNLFSVYFVPTGISVGASGAIMGLIGFVIVIGVKFKRSFPQKLSYVMIRTVILTAFLGLVARDIIDNAAHAGGLIGGLLIGIILLHKQQTLVPFKTNIIIKFFGLLSIVILFGGVLIISWLFIQNLLY
jgi:membrane associated rhomboid family serine protease